MMKITKAKLRSVIKEEMGVVLSEGLARTHNGEEITPQSVAGELFNLAAKVEALGEDFFSDSDSLADWVNQFMAKHNIMRESSTQRITQS